MKRFKTMLALSLMAAPCGIAWAQFDADSTIPPQPSTGMVAGPGNLALVQRAVEDAEREVENRAVQIERSRRDAEARDPAVRDRLERIQQRMYLSTESGDSQDPVLVIPRQEPDPEASAELEEDLAVMARILEKAAGSGGRARHAMGIAVQPNVLGNPTAPRNLYIEGYGALFFLNVDYPLAPPSDERRREPNEGAGTEWENARRELFSRGRDSTPQWRIVVPSGPGGEEYDEGRLTGLKNELIAALKNGAHIRRLRDDESVTVVVTGRAVDRNPPMIYGGPLIVGRPIGGGGDRMILRIGKTDVLALQNGTLSPEAFRDRVVVIGSGR